MKAVQRRRTVIFNIDNPYERELSDFCDSQSTNFSGFIKHIIAMYKNNRLKSDSSSEETLISQLGGDDEDCMSGIL